MDSNGAMVGGIEARWRTKSNKTGPRMPVTTFYVFVLPRMAVNESVRETQKRGMENKEKLALESTRHEGEKD